MVVTARLTKPVAFVYQQRVVAQPGGPAVVTWPGLTGGSEWSPVPFSPQTGLVYIDDRAICFRGDWDQVLVDVSRFRR